MRRAYAVRIAYIDRTGKGKVKIKINVICLMSVNATIWSG